MFHHSTTDYLMLTLRLVADAFVPLYATHYIGAGGVVINEKDELLVVCERFRGGRAPYYKLPGGALQPEEHLAEGVVREVSKKRACRPASTAWSVSGTGTVTGTTSPISTSSVA